MTGRSLSALFLDYSYPFLLESHTFVYSHPLARHVFLGLHLSELRDQRANISAKPLETPAVLVSLIDRPVPKSIGQLLTGDVAFLGNAFDAGGDGIEPRTVHLA